MWTLDSDQIIDMVNSAHGRLPLETPRRRKMLELLRKNLHSILEESRRWRTILSPEYGRYKVDNYLYPIRN